MASVLGVCGKRDSNRPNPRAKRYKFGVRANGRGLSNVHIVRPWMVLRKDVIFDNLWRDETSSNQRPTAAVVDEQNPRVVSMNIEGVGEVIVGERHFTYTEIANAVCSDVMSLVGQYMGDTRDEFMEAVARVRAFHDEERKKEEAAPSYHRRRPDYTEVNCLFLQQFYPAGCNVLGFMEETHRYDPDTVYASVRQVDGGACRNIVATVTRVCPDTGGCSYRLDALQDMSFWAEVTTAAERLA